MKSLIFALTVSLIMTASIKSAGDIIGEAYNSDDHQDVVAVTYG